VLSILLKRCSHAIQHIVVGQVGTSAAAQAGEHRLDPSPDISSCRLRSLDVDIHCPVMSGVIEQRHQGQQTACLARLPRSMQDEVLSLRDKRKYSVEIPTAKWRQAVVDIRFYRPRGVEETHFNLQRDYSSSLLSRPELYPRSVYGMALSCTTNGQFLGLLRRFRSGYAIWHPGCPSYPSCLSFLIAAMLLQVQ